MPVQGQGRSATSSAASTSSSSPAPNVSPTEPVADICTTPGCMEKKNPAEQVCFYCKQGRTGLIDEAMAGPAARFEPFLFNECNFTLHLHPRCTFAETRSCDRVCDAPWILRTVRCWYRAAGRGKQLACRRLAR